LGILYRYGFQNLVMLVRAKRCNILFDKRRKYGTGENKSEKQNYPEKGNKK